MRVLVVLAVFLLEACNQQQASSTAEAVGKAYNVSYLDNVIRNWQNKVADTDRCASYKARFEAAGSRYESAATGGFVNDMMKIWEEAKAANCQYFP